MSKDLKENRTHSLSKHKFVHQVRQVFRDWDIKVMSYVMIVIVMVAMIAATVAWFFFYKVVAVSHMGFTTAGNDSLMVEVKQGTKADATGNTTEHFVELKEGEEDSVFVDLDMPVFDNVEQYEVTVGDTAGEGNEENSSSGTESSESGENSGSGTTGNDNEDDSNSVTTGNGENSGNENGNSQTENNGNETSGTKMVNKMAPGVYGSITIRLIPLNKDINRYRITPAALFNYVDGNSDTVKEDGSVEVSAINNLATLQALAKGHILFFEKREKITDVASTTITIDGKEKSIADYTHNQKYVFYNPVDADSPMVGELKWNDSADKGEPTEVTVYWYWPYEYDNLSSSIKQEIQLPTNSEQLSDIVSDSKRLQYFDVDKMNEIVRRNISWNETQLYDYADTRIGTYVKSIKVHLKVDGYHEAETTEATTATEPTTESTTE